MKKVNIVIGCFIFLALFWFSIWLLSAGRHVGGKSTTEVCDSVEGLTVSIEAVDCRDAVLSASVDGNRSNSPLSYDYFSIEKLVGGEWHDLKKISNTTGERPPQSLYTGSNELLLDWKNVYGKLHPGIYRFILTFSSYVNDVPAPGDSLGLVFQMIDCKDRKSVV